VRAGSERRPAVAAFLDELARAAPHPGRPANTMGEECRSAS
jgi:hypothetical protein